jgi:hypothetical protein
MGKVYPLEVDPIVTDDGSTVGYMTKGHHDPQDFIDDLRGEWDQDADPKDISRGWWRVLPPDADGFKSYQESRPGPGAFPVTYTYEASDFIE